MRGGISRSALLVPGVRICLAAVGFASNVLIVRVLGPTPFGIFALSTAFIKIFSGCFGDALDLAVLRRVPLYLRTDRCQALRVAWAALWLRLGTGFGIVVIGMLFNAWIAEVFFRSDRDGVLVILAAVGVLGELLVRAVSSFFQSGEMFSQFLALDALLQGGRIGVFLVLNGLNALNVHTSLLVYVGASFVTLVVGALMLPRDALRVTPPDRRDIGDVFHYSKWMIMAMAIAATYERLDVFLLGYFKGSEQVGVYAAALTLAIIPEFVAGAVATVVQPKIVPLYSSRTFQAFARRYLRWAIPAVLTVAMTSYLFGGVIIPLLFSARYVASISLFQILVVGTLFSALVNPLHGGLMAMISPRRMVVATAAGLLVMVTGGSIVIPAMGSTGAALLVGFVRIGIGVSVLLMTHVTLRTGLALTAGVPEAPATRQRQDVSETDCRVPGGRR